MQEGALFNTIIMQFRLSFLTGGVIFKKPVQSNVRCSDIESLFERLGAEISEGSGS